MKNKPQKEKLKNTTAYDLANECIDKMAKNMFKSQPQEEWEVRFDRIQEEWEKHRTMNTCPICDSPTGHTSIKSFIKNLISEIRKEERELVIKEILDKINIDKSGRDITIYELGDWLIKKIPRTN